MTIDTSPAAILKLAEHGLGLGYKDEAYLMLLAVAAEKEAQAKQEPFAFVQYVDGYSPKFFLASEFPGMDQQQWPSSVTIRALYLSQQPVAEKQSNKCPRQSGQCWAEFFDREAEVQQTEPTLSGTAILSRNMVAPADVPMPEPCGVLDVYNMENVYKHSDVIAHREAYANARVAAIDAYKAAVAVGADVPLPAHTISGPAGTGAYFNGHTDAALIAHREAYAAAKVAAERERCVSIIEGYQVPVGNSAAGEMAAEWTMAALREVRDAIRASQKGTL